MAPSEQPSACSSCGAPLGQLAAAETLCPACLLATAIEDLDSAPPGPAGRDRAPSVDALGERAPSLEFIELLGAGGSGWVYLARQRSLDRLVAVKVLRNAGRAVAAERFAHEAKTLARLSHPGLVTLFDYGALETAPDGSSTGESYLVMEYVPGPTLRQKLQSGPLPPHEAVRITRQIADAVAYAHAQGVVHRDLKPENVIFASEEGSATAKVADFGIAKLVESAAPRSATSLTATGLVIGTPYYLAPESWSGPDGPGPRSDVYSLGVMVYEMLTGRLPVGVFAPPDAPPGVSAAVLRALAADPCERFASLEEFAVALEANSAATSSGQRRLLLPLALAVGAATFGGWALWSTPRPTAIANPDRTDEEATVPSKPLTTSTDPEPTAASEPAVLDLISPTERESHEKPGAEITRLAIRGRRAFDKRLEFEVRFDEAMKPLPDDASLYWVLTTMSGERFSGRLPSRDGRETITVSESVRALRGGLWPGTLYLEERWGESESASRRVSPLFQVQGWHASGLGDF